MFPSTVMRSWFVKQLAALILQLPAIKLQQDDIINREILKPTSHGKEYELFHQTFALVFVLHIDLRSIVMASSVHTDQMFPSAARFHLFSAEQPSVNI